MSSLDLPRYEYWKSHSDAWLSSGLSQAAYCMQAGINHATFSYWRTRIKRQSVQAVGASRFQSVSGSTGTGASIQLMLPNGVRIGLTESSSPSVLREVLEFVGGLPCCA